jgi:molybdopterin converting factor small subunit
MIKSFIRSIFGSALEDKAEVEVMYFGRVSDALMMTSERIGISIEEYTLEKMLNRLRQRGDRWAYELDNSHVICSINSKKALLSDNIRIGDEVGIYSRKSMFEM